MFKKDILLIDVELTGLDPKRHELIQLAAVLLDRKTLRIKQEFASFIKPKKWQTRDPEAMAVNKISKQDLDSAPSLLKVITEFDQLFPKDVTLAHYGGIADTDFLRHAFSALGKKYAPRYFPYDYHVLDLWPICYAYMALHRKLNNRKRFAGFSMENLIERFRLKGEDRHDALADCKVEAEIFRSIMLELKKKI